jgi:hypothetical protein
MPDLISIEESIYLPRLSSRCLVIIRLLDERHGRWSGHTMSENHFLSGSSVKLVERRVWMGSGL